MMFSHVREAFPLPMIGRRLGLALLPIAGYAGAVALLLECLPVQLTKPGGVAGAIDGIILAMLLNFRNRAAYERWWEGRRLWGQLTNDIRNLVAKLAAFLPADAPDRARAAACIEWFPEALMRHLRSEPFDLNRLPEQDRPSSKPAHVPLYIAGRLFLFTARWRRENLIDMGTLLTIEPHLRALLDVAGGCERIRNTPLSPSYKGLLRLGIGLNILLMPWYAIVEIGLWGIPVYLVVAFFLLGVEMIDTVVEEPFGKSGDELDLERYCGTMRDAVRTCMPAAAS